MGRAAYVYILTNRRYGTLYVGVTSSLLQRVWEHRGDFIQGFTSRHQLKRLVWYEMHESIEAAIWREKQIKRWHRDWKVNLVQAMNPTWRDLYVDLTA
jgi:putative endonuclease